MSQGATEPGQEPGTGAPAAGQEPSATGGQGQDPAGGQGQQAATPPADPATFDASTIQDPTVRAYVEAQQRAATEARQEAAARRTELRALQAANETDAQRQAREAQEAETARQAETTRLSALETENRELRVSGAATDAARTANAHNPALVAGMLAPKVELGDDGKPKNLDTLLTELRQSDPYLFRRTRTDAGQGAGGGEGTPTTDMNDAIRGALAARRGHG